MEKLPLVYYGNELKELQYGDSINLQVTDIDGNVYNTIKIGSQIWMKENLKTTKYRNGDQILHISGNEDWGAAAISGSGAYCYYGNNIETGSIYGALYNTIAVNDTRNLAPEGWHVATIFDWWNLLEYVGFSWNLPGQASFYLVESGNQYWISNENQSNSYGLSILPSGVRGVGGTFANIGTGFYFHTIKSQNFLCIFTGDNENMDKNLFSDSIMEIIGLGSSVRCVKDEEILINRIE